MPVISNIIRTLASPFRDWAEAASEHAKLVSGARAEQRLGTEGEVFDPAAARIAQNERDQLVRRPNQPL